MCLNYMSVTVVTVVWGLTMCVSFLTEGETSNELVFLSGCVVVLNCDVPVAQITQANPPHPQAVVTYR